MSIRKIKVKERNNGMKYCTFCKIEKDGERVDAIWRDAYPSFACEIHKDELEEEEPNQHLTEADYQTWMKL